MKHDTNPHINAAWQVGDLALCKHLGAWFREGRNAHSDGPVAGGVYAVTKVRDVEHPLGGTATVLFFDDWPDSGWSATAFVKITPPALGALQADQETEHA